MAQTRRSRGGDGPGFDNTVSTTLQHSYRTAEDAAEQITEASRWIDAADLVLFAALDAVGDVSLAEAAEHVVVLHGRARRCLDLAVVT